MAKENEKINLDESSEISKSTSIAIEDIDRETLAEVTTYLKTRAGKSSNEEKEKSDQEFISDKDIHDLLQLLPAVAYLNVTGLREMVEQKIADTMEGKSVAWIREVFGLTNDLDVEDAARQMNPWAFND
ncbi:hypothetical protein ABFS82_10G141500 [Erythranthe guttata]|uniref:SKP1 component dimerisation domain-containing protein n=1 Tax=Erythranthe guttata TaxID=4155 RepID=A0A022QQX4_ERYGU|nr:PREDICTED: SKP1-like protein 14 [Erythranthe guttata]EYU30346.1 hypothetical protein MIMGU_mgv11b016388mg [Erythranthe guttata]|eukprot:XP_012845835.1 PREDICTED: SKP1-like protein 14 [Erythranthe guttata]